MYWYICSQMQRVNKNRKEGKKMLTLETFEEASECVKRVIQETKLIYSEYFSAQTGNKVYLKASLHLLLHHLLSLL